MIILASNIVEIIGAIGAIITPIAVAIIGLLQYSNNKKLKVIGENVDGKMEKLLQATGAAKKAEGKLEQIQESATTATDVVQAIKDDPDIDLTKK